MGFNNNGPLAEVAKKSKQERIEERKAKRREGMMKEEKTQSPEPLTAEQKLEEKRRQEDAQRSSDLQSAMELFGGIWSLSLGQCDIRTPKQDTFKHFFNDP